MPINIIERSLFGPGYSLKYITGWDNLFKNDRYSGQLRFYSADPKYVVPVEVLADRNRLKEEDITVIVNPLHNTKIKEIEQIVNDNIDPIYEMCKASPAMEFLLDLKNMLILTDQDFTTFFPRFGLNTIFKFQNVSDRYYYCLVNPSKNTPDADFYAWLISYIYSAAVCLVPRTEPKPFAKLFLQAITLMSSSGNSNKKIHIAHKDTILNCGLSDCGELLLDVPGNTKRYEQLVEKSIEQFSKKSRSKKNVL